MTNPGELGLLRHLLAASSPYIFAFDGQGRYLYASPGAAAALGLTPEAMVGKSWRELALPAQVAQALDAHLQAVFATGEPSVFDVAVPMAEGPRVHEYTLKPMGEAEAPLVICTVNDVTERRQAEEDRLLLARMREMNQQMALSSLRGQEMVELLATQSPDTMFFQDLDLCYVWVVNPLPRFRTEQVAGKTDFDLFDQDGARRLTEIKRGVIETGVQTRAEIPMIVAGERKHYEGIYEPRRDPTGRVVGVFGYLRDMTERKLREEERERLLVEKEALLASEQQARVEADAALKARDEFMSIAAHELKTPVTSLQGFAQVMLRQFEKTGAFDPARLTQALKIIDEQSKRLSKLTEQLLNLSRLQSGKFMLAREDADVAALVEDLVSSMRHSEPSRAIDLRHNGAVSAFVDPMRLEQVVTNLLDNALKFSPSTSPVLVEVSEDGAGWLEIAVQDHGIGIPEETRGEIFGRFYQAHPERHHGGLGMGLFISSQIVEMHGGSIAVEQAEGGGSRFVVRLPRRPDGGDSHQVILT